MEKKRSYKPPPKKGHEHRLLCWPTDVKKKKSGLSSEQEKVGCVRLANAYLAPSGPSTHLPTKLATSQPRCVFFYIGSFISDPGEMKSGGKGMIKFGVKRKTKLGKIVKKRAFEPQAC